MNIRNARISGWKARLRKKHREEAETRQTRYNALSLSEKIDKAKSRRGNSSQELKRLTRETRNG